jgi:hypothetical protein
MSPTAARRIAALIVSLAGSAVAVGEETSFPNETNDTATVTQLAPASIPDQSSASRGTAPYPLTPNWTLNLRRQVGAVRIADMDGDGRNDLVIGCYTSNSFPPYTDWRDMIVYNTPTGLEAAPTWISTDQTHTGDIQVGDINLDGKMDLVAISGGGGFAPPRIYYGGTGPRGGPATTATWFATPPTAGWATSGELFDADGDGDLDLITTNQGVSPNAFRPMYFWRNLQVQGGGMPTSPVWSSTESSIQNTVATADMDLDGLPEIGVAKWVNFKSGLYENNAGTPTPAPTWEATTTSGDRGAAWADVDGNGYPDLMIGGASTTIQSRLYSNTAGVLTQTWSASLAFVGQQEIAFADVNRDGRPDYAEVHFSNGQTHIFINENGVLHTTPDWTFDAPEVGNALAFGDLNGDNRPDLAVGYSGDISVRVFYAVPPPCPADINNDGAVNTQDLTIFLANFGQSVPPGTNGDLDGNGTINTQDLTAFLAAFGVPCP